MDWGSGFRFLAPSWRRTEAACGPRTMRTVARRCTAFLRQRGRSRRSKSPDRPVGASRTVIAIIDDEPSVALSLSRLCTALGYTPVAFASGREFLESLGTKGRGPDCVLVDAHMPDMTGLELHHQLARDGRRFPVIVMTADDTVEVRQRYVEAGVSDYLSKPLDSADLVAAIQRALALRK